MVPFEQDEEVVIGVGVGATISEDFVMGGSLQERTLRPSLGPDASVTGKLSFEAPTRLDGKLKGEVRANDFLLIGPKGFVDGTVRAAELIVQGEVHGDVCVDRRVEISASGRVYGRIEASGLLVQRGGQVDGDCCIRPSATPARPAAQEASSRPATPSPHDPAHKEIHLP